MFDTAVRLYIVARVRGIAIQESNKAVEIRNTSTNPSRNASTVMDPIVDRRSSFEAYIL